MTMGFKEFEKDSDDSDSDSMSYSSDELSEEERQDDISANG